ncbi:MAG: NAD(P)H-hydrate dehydratase [Candidatus Hydrothermales bacterium]
MFVVTPLEMKEIDRRTIEEFGLDGRILMENAGRSVFEVILKKYPDSYKFTILCGKGNNGGDGFVVARYLLNRGKDVNVYLYGSPQELKGESLYNFRLLELMRTKVKILDYNDPELKFDILSSDVVVDAIFGTGFKGEIPKDLKLVMSLLKERRGKLVAVDIPSGVDGETGEAEAFLPQCDLTVTFAFPKLGHVLYPGRDKVGELYVTDIGVPGFYSDSIRRKIIFPEDVYPFLPVREKNVHKGKCGRVLILGGSKGYGGAVYLASKAAYFAGAGLVYTAIPEDVYPSIEANLVEAVKVPLPSKNGRLFSKSISPIIEYLEKIDVVAFGPGLQRADETKSFILELLEKIKDKRVLIDADGIVLLRDNKEVFKERKEATIITPHPGEMSLFLGEKSAEEVDKKRVEVAESVSFEYDIVVVLKGAPTVISSSYGTRICILGNPGMATGGSGDVLTGLIAGLWAQGIPSEKAAQLGVFLHALAGDIAASKKGIYSIVATDILEEIPSAFNYKFQLESIGLTTKILPLI